MCVCVYIYIYIHIHTHTHTNNFFSFYSTWNIFHSPKFLLGLAHFSFSVTVLYLPCDVFSPIIFHDRFSTLFHNNNMLHLYNTLQYVLFSVKLIIKFSVINLTWLYPLSLHSPLSFLVREKFQYLPVFTQIISIYMTSSTPSLTFECSVPINHFPCVETRVHQHHYLITSNPTFIPYSPT